MRKFGLIGFPLGHSFSGKYFRDKFQQEQIVDCIYSNYELSSITDLSTVLQDSELEGLNVTIPYKQSVVPFLNEKDAVVADTGACNCIRIRNGNLTGYNTDVIGFEKALDEKLLPQDRNALILGTGGSSLAVAWVLKKKNISYLSVSRSPGNGQLHYSDLDRAVLEHHSLIINTTPLGMSPDVAACPDIPYAWIDARHYLFDLIYNPAHTRFLQNGEARGARIKNGAQMLAIQADASWSIWNPPGKDPNGLG